MFHFIFYYQQRKQLQRYNLFFTKQIFEAFFCIFQTKTRQIHPHHCPTTTCKIVIKLGNLMSIFSKIFDFICMFQKILLPLPDNLEY